MTMKKIGLSALSAALLSTAAFSATLETGSNLESISTELLSVQAVDINVSQPIRFQCNMNKTDVSTANAAGVQLTIAGLNNVSSLSVYKLNAKDGNVSGAAVANFSNVVASKDLAVFDGNTSASIVEDSYYIIADSGLGDGALPSAQVITAGNLTVAVPQKSTSVTAKVEVVSNDGVSVLDTGTGAIANAKQQYSLTVDTKANALIDAAAGFFAFTSTYGGGTQSTDDIAFKFVNNTDITHHATNTALSAVLTYDQNTSGIFDSVTGNQSGSNSGPTVAATQNDMNVTYTTAANDTNTSDVYTTTFNKSSETAGKIEVTNFKLSGLVTFDGSTGYNLANNLDAGAWTIYGYTAQIPNVRNKSTLHTYVNITNSSSIPADAIFTILPETDGINASEAICTSNEGAIPANASRKFDMANVLANSDCSDAVKSGVNMAVELAVPTQPDSVYANAYTKNDNINDFIPLPVYNTSKMAY